MDKQSQSTVSIPGSRWPRAGSWQCCPLVARRLGGADMRAMSAVLFATARPRIKGSATSGFGLWWRLPGLDLLMDSSSLRSTPLVAGSPPSSTPSTGHQDGRHLPRRYSLQKHLNRAYRGVTAGRATSVCVGVVVDHLALTTRLSGTARTARPSSSRTRCSTTRQTRRPGWKAELATPP